MNWDIATAIAEILGMIAVVVSILYLAVQTKLTRLAAQHTSLIGVADAHSRWRSALFENPALAELVARDNAGEALTASEKIQIRNLHMDLFVSSVVGTFTADGDAPRAEEHYLAGILINNPSAVREWKYQRKFMELTAPQFSEAIDARLIEAGIE